MKKSWEALNNSLRNCDERIGMGCKALFAAKAQAIGKKSNAADRPSLLERRPQGVMQSFPCSSRGFTLVELMIVVAIIAILGAIALPSYQESVRKGWRAEGRAALNTLMLEQERYHAQNGTYLSFMPGSTTVPFKTHSGNSVKDSAYKLSALACTGEFISRCVTLSADPNRPDPKVGTLTLSSTGRKSCSTSSTECWK